MEGFVELDPTLDAAAEAWEFDPGFATATELAPPKRRAAPDEEADDAAWLFRQASQAEKTDLGAVEGAQRRVVVRDRVRALVRELSDFGGDPERRAATLAAVATLRLACVRADGWRGSDYDWPLLSD